MMRKMPKFIAAFAAAAVMLISSGPGVTAPAAAAGTFDFSSCVQNKYSGSVMLLMDESGSIYGTGGKPGSDTKNYRISASKIMLDKLQQVSDAYDAPINVMLAGLGDDFKVRSAGDQGWVALEPKQPKTGLAELTTAVEAWKSPAADKNGRETDLYSSLEGAQKAFASQTECKLLVLFKDGKDYQYFNKDVSTPVSDEDIQTMLDSGKPRDAEKLAEEQICRGGGLADGFRNTNTYLLTVALGSGSAGSEFKKIKDVAEGGGACGDLPGFGKLLVVPIASDLPAQFARVLDPNFIPASRTNSFPFNMTNALTGITILTSGEFGAFDDYTITPPKTCLGGKQVFKRGGEIEGQFGAGVQWNSQWYDAEAFKIVINKEDGADDKCWVGKWMVEPTTSAAGKSSSVIEFDANLQAQATFADKNFYLIPDGAAKDFTVNLSKVSPQTPVDAAALDKSLTFKISGELQDAQGKVLKTVFTGIDRSSIATAQKIDAKDIPVGTYRLVMNLETAVQGLGVPLRPVRTETTIEVRNKNRTPKTLGSVAFGDIDGKKVVEKEVTFLGSPDAAFKLEFLDKDSKVVAVQRPEGLSYEFVKSSAGSSFQIPKGTGETKVRIAIQVSGKDEVNKRGLVSGQLNVKAVPVGSESDAELISIPFTANQTPEANVGLQWLFILLFTLIGLAVTLAALQLVAWLVAKFPKPIDIVNQSIQALSIDGRIENNMFVPNDASAMAKISDSRQWNDIQVEADRKSAYVGDSVFRAKAPGWRLGSPGFGVIDSPDVLGWSSGAVGGEGDTSATGRPLLPLHLQNCWVIAIDRDKLPVDPIGASIPAKATLIFGTKVDTAASFDGGFGGAVADTSSDRQMLFDSLQASIAYKLPSLFGRGPSASGDAVSKPSKPAKRDKTQQDAAPQVDPNFTFGQKDPNDPFA
jgi:hypothetical protein